MSDEQDSGGRRPIMTSKSDLPVGAELRTTHGTRWVKVAPNEWRVRGDWGALDEFTAYTDLDVYGEEV